MRVAFTTLGCKINQCETEAMQHAAMAEGSSVVPFDADADVYVINTCSVTAKSDYQCRQVIRAAVRRKEGARVIVTGCYAETRPQEIRSIPGVSLVLKNGEKAQIARFLSTSVSTSCSPARRDPEPVTRRTRTFLKIQDGCDSRCSYCIVPFARGGSRSVPREEVIQLFDDAVGAGAPEVVLSGIHIGRYGHDLGAGETLTGLVGELMARRGKARLRLSSIEPNELTSELISMAGQGLCRHFHVPLQSGDDAILCSMQRTYGAASYAALVSSVAARLPDVAIGADVMVGFPGESDKAFRNTYDLVASLPLTHLHVFSYSPRPGTPAASMTDQVPGQVKKERSEALRALESKKNLLFRNRLIGKALTVVLEEEKKDGIGRFTGLSDNYVRVSVSGADRHDLGREINIVVTDINDSGLLGTISSTL